MAYRPVIGRRAFLRLRASSGRSSSTWLIKKLLASMMVIGALSFTVAGGTFALLSSQVSNGSSAISSGTLTLNDVVNSGSSCFSYGGPVSPGNVNTTCQAVFASTAENYPGTPRTATLTITDNGSLDGSDLSVYMPSCTNTLTPVTTVHGGGNPCATGGAQLYIQETTGSGSTCFFPASAGACAFAANSLSIFTANYSTASGALHLGPISHGQTRTFVIGMQLPSGASNTLQGQAAQFGLTWHITS